jgi:uncharacterized membrane protein (DUF485 family)
MEDISTPCATRRKYRLWRGLRRPGSCGATPLGISTLRSSRQPIAPTQTRSPLSACVGFASTSGQAAGTPSLHAALTLRACSSHPGDDMETDLARKISALPKYQELKRKRSSFGWWLTLAMMVVYYGFILLVAFNKPFLSQRLGDGVMTMGIPIGFGVIVFTIVITAIYVRRANGEFDDLNDAITKAVLK